MSGYYDGNDERLMQEFVTPKALGGLQVQQAIEAVAASYVSGAGYSDETSYKSDIAKVSRRLQASLGTGIQSIATQIAHEKALGKEAYTSYADILPQSNSHELLRGISGATIPDRVGMKSVRNNMRGIAAVYGYGSASSNKRGATGLNTPRVLNDDLDILNEKTLELGPGLFGTSKSATDIDFYNEGYERDSTYLKIPTALSVAADEQKRLNEDYSSGGVAGTFRFVGPMPKNTTAPASTTPVESSPLMFSPELSIIRKPLAEEVVETFIGPPRPFTGPVNPLKFHNVEQGTPEWDSLRANNVSASVAGSLLGHNKHSDPLAAVLQAVGFNPFGIENIHNQNFERGHKLEEIGRAKYAAKTGFRVDQTGFVTNERYPGLGVSPDGLVGDDGLVEFKAPFKPFDPANKPEYLDQVQMQMAITGRKWADIAQVFESYGNDGKAHQWLGRVDRVHHDPKWAEENAERLQNFGNIIKEGRSLMDNVGSGSMSKEEFIDVMSKAVAKGNVEGVELLRSRSPEAVPRSENVGDTAKSGYGYGRPVQRGNEIVDYGGRGRYSGGGDGYVPNWTAGNGGSPLLLTGPDNTSTEEDADFDQSMSKAEFDKTMRDAVSGKAFKQEPTTSDKVGNALKQILASKAGGSGSGSLIKLLSAVNPGLALGTAAVVGAAQAASDGIDALQSEFTSAASAGIFNVNAYTTSNNNLEALGLSENQARSLTGTVGNAAATLSAGDPTGMSKIVTGSRGLIQIQDIRNNTDPSQLVALAAKRAKERGISGQQFAGLMSLAGLDGAASAYSATESTMSDNAGRHDNIMSQADADASAAAMSDLRNTQITLSPRYAGLNIGESSLSTGVMGSISSTLAGGVHGLVQGARSASKAISHLSGDITGAINSGYDVFKLAEESYIAQESGGNPHAKNPFGSAKGLYQVTNDTAKTPWLGVAPAKNTSDDERNRVGKDLFQASLKHYGSDITASILAMHEGPGVVDRLIKDHPDDWGNHLTDEEELYLRGIDKKFQAGLKTIRSGATAAPFVTNHNTAQPAQKVDVNVSISGSTATAAVAVNNKSVKRKDVRLDVGGNTHNIVS